MRILSFIVGALLIALNTIIYSDGQEFRFRLDNAAGWGYFLGTNFLFIVGGILVIFAISSTSKTLSAPTYRRYMEQFMDIHNEILVEKTLQQLFSGNRNQAIKVTEGFTNSDRDARNFLLALIAHRGNQKEQVISLLEDINEGVDEAFGDFYYLLAVAYREANEERSATYRKMATIHNTLLFHKEAARLLNTTPRKQHTAKTV